MKKLSRAEEILFGESHMQGIARYETVNFALSCEGEKYRHFGPRSLFNTNVGPFQEIDTLVEDQTVIKIYQLESKRALIRVKYDFFDCSTAIRQTVSVENCGDDLLEINHLSSALITGLGLDGLLPWYHRDRFLLHTCDMTWQGECQWQQSTFHDMGLVPTTTHYNMKDFRLQSTGSWTTASRYPMLVLEDRETGRSFFLELEPAASWEIGIGNPTLGFAEDGCIAVEANCADIHHDGWLCQLKPGEKYTAQPCVYGMVDGGFEAAIAELIFYKRADSLVKPVSRTIPVVYNCYMDGIFSNPTTETLLPLIDKCAQIGVDIFCIDAGWFRSHVPGADNAIGTYAIAEDRFPGYGLKGIFDYMKSKNIVPGIWIEAECAEVGYGYRLSENCLCQRNGKPLGNTRAFFNFREKAVRDYMMDIIGRLYGLGVRYIKNDYNQTTGIGFSNYGECCSIENAAGIHAILSFFDEVRAKYPDLMLENCSSGGMREDNNFLKHFALQSTSDQELFFRNPSIVSGSLACMAPEKAGVWALTYPCYCNGESDRPFNDAELRTKKQLEMADGEETIFNMVSGMIGNLYMAGRIDWCDEWNQELIGEGISFYKAHSDLILNAVPIWPCGTFKIDEEGIFCTGLNDRKNRKILLAIWNIHAHHTTAMIDLSPYVPASAEVILAYPSKDTRASYVFNRANQRLSVKLPGKKYSARLFEIRY